MANSVTRDVALFKLTSAGDSEQSVNNDQSVGMDYGVKENSDIGVVAYDWDIPSRKTDVPAPANKAITNPDTGISPITLTIQIVVNEKFSDQRGVGLLTLWGLQNKEVRGIFSKARFGVRNNKKPWMNYSPVDGAGWKLVDVKFSDDLIYGGRMDGTIILEYAGDSTKLAAKIQQTLDSGQY